MTASPSLRPGTWIADPNEPTNALKPNADGSINVGSATSPTPTYEPGLVYAPTSVSKTRPTDTTPYTGPTATVTGDLMANSTTAGSVSPYSFQIPSVFGSGAAEGLVNFVEVATSWAFTGTIRAHLFETTAPTVSAGDNSAFALSNFSANTYLGYVDLAMSPGGNGGAIGASNSIRLPYDMTHNESIYALLEAGSSITPTNAGTLIVKIKVLRTR